MANIEFGNDVCEAVAKNPIYFGIQKWDVLKGFSVVKLNTKSTKTRHLKYHKYNLGSLYGDIYIDTDNDKNDQPRLNIYWPWADRKEPASAHGLGGRAMHPNQEKIISFIKKEIAITAKATMSQKRKELNAKKMPKNETFYTLRNFGFKEISGLSEYNKLLSLEKNLSLVLPTKFAVSKINIQDFLKNVSPEKQTEVLLKFIFNQGLENALKLQFIEELIRSAKKENMTKVNSESFNWYGDASVSRIADYIQTLK